MPVRICLIGAGRAGRVHARNLCESVKEATLVAIVDPVLEARETLAREFDVPGQFATLEEALSGSAFDAVVITTPTFTHRDVAIEAAAAGKHIFCEKPMALTLEQCDQMIAAAETAQVLLQIGFMRRFDPAFVEAAERIRSGAIGRPMIIKTHTRGPGLPPPWARDLATSNGMLAEVNSHDWDTLRWLAGADYERVYAEVSNFKGSSHGITTEHFYDNAVVSVRMESGALGLIDGTCPAEYGYDARAEVVGERGLLQIGELKGEAILTCVDGAQGLIQPVSRAWPQRFAWGYIYEMRHFVSAIRQGTTPRVTGQDGRWAVAGVLAATRSFLEGRPVPVAEVLDKVGRK